MMQHTDNCVCVYGPGPLRLRKADNRQDFVLDAVGETDGLRWGIQWLSVNMEKANALCDLFAFVLAPQTLLFKLFYAFAEAAAGRSSC